MPLDSDTEDAMDLGKLYFSFRTRIRKTKCERERGAGFNLPVKFIY